ncbi:putative membrane protein [Dickeya dianthicola RNS04.9]|nr:AEC family transporter [Dickeya dianthicola]ATO34228.1 putative membrane protein [Dickeya dianthicola RNS04.9]MCI4154201.1 AEC family transporter [Dickeya dianthicola]MCI4174032.1 AEC family transporter [Dickeya dianthicola]MCI4175980.1 AEC family transporter [Dickeya dianthicola]MCI4222542.1 AEC family transporter [Dickeya dianthicola]
MILIAMGFLLRSRNLIDYGFWLPCEKLNYFYLFPALMFSQVGKADLSQFPVKPIAWSILGAVFIGGGILWLWRIWLKQPGPIFSSVIQGALRPNTYIGVAAAAATYGHTGLTVTSISIAVAIPLLNVVSIVILMHYGQGVRPGWRQILKALVKNPVIVSVLLGLVFNYSGLPLPETVDNLLKVLGGASLPLGLLAVGAGLNIQAARSAQWTVLQSSFVKLLLVPILTLLIGIYLGVSGPVLATVVLFNALPCTPSAYIMAKLLGGDYQLSAGIITIQTLLAAVTIPLMLMLTQL